MQPSSRISGATFIGIRDGLNRLGGYTYTKFKFAPAPYYLSSDFINPIFEGNKISVDVRGTSDGYKKLDSYSEKPGGINLIAI